MTDHTPHSNRSFTADDLRLYLAGRMNVADMHALEQAALEDPFLADALEGMKLAQQSLPEGKWSEEIAGLQKELALRTRPNRKGGTLLSLGLWRAVAALLLISLAGSAAYWVWFRSTPQATTLANRSEPVTDSSQSSASLPERALADTINKSEEKQPAAAPAGIESGRERGNDQPSAARTESAAATKPAAEAIAAEAPAKSAALIRQTPPSAPIKTPPAAAARDEIVTVQVENKPAKAAARNDSDISSDQFGIVRGKSSTDQLTLNQFQGQVTDQENRPIPNAVVSTSDRSTIVRTDESGLFRLSSPDSLLDLRVSSLGYKAASIRLSNHDNPSLQLMPDSGQLSRQQVTGYFNRARREADSMVIENRRNNPRVTPEDGWNAFAQYLADNKRSLPVKEKGSVVLAFELDAKGTLKNLHVLESLGNRQDEEALRLIEQGPSWRLLRGKRATVTLRINFQ